MTKHYDDSLSALIMNIFVLSTDPKEAAEMHCDQHICKMLLEYAQILCTAAFKLGIKNVPYRPTHLNHPCTIWAGESPENFKWLLSLVEHCHNEYVKRYGKQHATYKTLRRWLAVRPMTSVPFPKRGLTPFAQAMPEQYRDPDPVKAYRNYYIKDKLFTRYYHNAPPSWLTEGRKHHGLPLPYVGSGTDR